MVGIGDGANLIDVSVVGIGDGPLGGNVVGSLVGRSVTSIPCRVFMAYIFPFRTANGQVGAGLLRTSAKSPTVWSTASVDEHFGTGQLCIKIQMS